MTGPGLGRRYWDALTGVDRDPRPRNRIRGRAGYSPGRRYAASLLGVRLPVKAAYSTAAQPVRASVAQPTRRKRFDTAPNWPELTFAGPLPVPQLGAPAGRDPQTVGPDRRRVVQRPRAAAVFAAAAVVAASLVAVDIVTKTGHSPGDSSSNPPGEVSQAATPTMAAPSTSTAAGSTDNPDAPPWATPAGIGDLDTAQLPPVGAPWRCADLSGSPVQGPGGSGTAADVVAAFEYDVYVKRDAVAAESLFADDLTAADTQAIGHYIAGLPAGTGYCASVVGDGSSIAIIQVVESRPGRPPSPFASYAGLTTRVHGGRVEYRFTGLRQGR